MNKKGFTLVELLAVIAILAILVIVALPNVLKMYNKAKKNSFTNEVNTLIGTTRQQYLLNGGIAQVYSNAPGSPKQLNLTGNSRLKYYVEMDSQGKITKLQVTNGDYQYNMSETSGIDVAQINDVESVSETENVVIIDSSLFREYVYTRGGTITISSTILSSIRTYDNYNTLTTSYPFFIRHTLEGNIVVESHIGFVNNDNVYYIKGGDNGNSFDDNQSILNTAFGSSNCRYYSVNSYQCNKLNVVNAIINKNGTVSAYLSGFQCYVDENGSSDCDWDA